MDSLRKLAEKTRPDKSTSSDSDTGSVLTWDDPRETRNPQHWGIWTKVFHTTVPCFLAFVITFATSVTVPATQLIAAEFNISRTESLLPLTLYTLGVAFGPVFIAPLSEEFGRKYIYLGTISCLLAFTGGAAGAQNFATLLVCRFLAGFLGSSGIAVGAGTIADIWALEKAGAQASLLFILGPFLGPTLGPLAGAYLLESHDNDWRWTQYIVLMVGAPIWLGSLLMKETSKDRILRKELHSETPAAKRRVHHKILEAMVRPCKMLVQEVIVSSLALYTAFSYAMIFSYFASSSYVLQLYYGFDLRQIGLSFISVIIGYLIATVIFAVFDKTLFARAAKKSPTGKAEPENRLYAALVGSVFLPAALFWYAWEANPGGNWAAEVASGIFLGLGAFTLFLSAITYMVDFYRAKAAASAIAANGILRYTLGAVFPLFTVQMYQNLGVHNASTIFACLSVLLLPIPWLLFRYGKWLRSKSHFIPQEAAPAPAPVAEP
ncbi:MFS general substrate transporter [Thozetella sp. PMI_491]|nr:MFS general substrate transporter [Thozetella sp. PMI_491]